MDSAEGGAKRKRTAGRPVDAPNNLDLEAYIGDYSGHARIDRLLFIAQRCPALEIDAYKLALQELQANTADTARYTQAATRLVDAQKARGLAPSRIDMAWVEEKQLATKAKLDKLEAELKGYRNNLIKESIRMGYNDLGSHYYYCGELNNALKSYTRTRDYCTTAKHIVDMCLTVIKISIELGTYSHVQSFVIKAESACDPGDRSLLNAKLKCCSALAQLDSAQFKPAARAFLETSFDLQNNFNEVISMKDIAIYGGLCALATFDRPELKSKVIDNAEFKQFLEIEPDIREMIWSFYNSKYSLCLEVLERWRNDFLLDIHLHPHVDSLYRLIRRKGLKQYFSPFLSVDLHRMAAAFNTTLGILDRELVELIKDNEIQARIDSHNKVLRVKQVDLRTTVFADAVQAGMEYENTTKEILLRVNLMKNNFIVGARSGNRSRQSHRAQSREAMEVD